MNDSQNIAVMIDIDWAIKRHCEVVNGIQQYARKRGGWTLFHDLYPARALHRYDAIIGRITEDIAREAAVAGIPVVNTWFSSPVARDLPTVVPDFLSVSNMAADHLMARGFRNFGFVGHATEFDRFLGRVFKEQLKAAGFPCSTIFVSDRYTATPKDWTRFSEKMENWVESWNTPIGILSSEDSLNRHLLTVCEYHGVKIPQDAALIGLHDEPNYCLSPEMSLSSIDMGYEQIGTYAAELLDDLMAGKPCPDEKMIQLPPRFLSARQSTDAYVVKDPLMSVALRFIAENSHKPIKVEDVATGVNVTRRTLERRFKKHGERTVAQEILYFRIERLKRLLLQTEEPVKYLSHEVGFKDAVQMCTVFRRIEGITPSAYRRKHKGDGR